MELDVYGRSLTLESITLSSREDVLCCTKDHEMIVNRNVLRRQAPELDNWLQYRRDKTLYSHDLIRLGFTESANTRHDTGKDTREYQIKRIALSSGKEDGWRKGRYYASEKLRGGPATFWEILYHSIETHLVPIEGDPGSPIMSDVEEATETGPGIPSVVLAYSPSRRAEYMDELDKWCQENVGRFFKLTCPGYRGYSSKTVRYRVDTMPVFCYSPHGECIRSAVANAIGAFAGGKDSLSMLRKGPIPLKGLGLAGSWLERTMKVYRLQNVCVPKDQETESWLMQQREGVYIATLCGYDKSSETVEHTLTVDANRRLVYDCMEKTALRMREGVLECCVGDSFELLGVSELKMITKQKVGSGRNKNRKIPPEVQKARKNANPDYKKSRTKKRKVRKTRRLRHDDDDE